MIDLRPFSIPGVPDVFVLGALERNVSIQLQQVRAINLAWALSDARSVAVLGGGFAGVTFAAAAARRGARVHLFEQGRELLAWQRHNRTRWIHPHIHEWPLPGWSEPGAQLPVCDWSAGLSADMAAQVLAAFAAQAPTVGLTFGSSPSTLPTGFDAVVLALGLGVERSFGARPLVSYWADDSLPEAGTHLVSGIGEGGVIDALYLCLREFSHASVADALDPIPGMSRVRAAILDIESQARPDELDITRANELLSSRYAELPVPAAADDVLRARLRGDTQVILNGPQRFPLSPAADRLNRFLISRLIALGKLTYRPGKITQIEADRVQLDDGAWIACSKVHVRHGTVPALAPAFPQLWARYEPHRRALPFGVPAREWSL